MATRISQEFLDRLLSRVDIVAVIDTRVPLRKAGREFVACCPFHGEKTPSFTVSPGKQFYHCFGCGAHGTAIGFLMQYEHLGFLDTVEELARSVGLELPRGVSTIENDHGSVLSLVEEADHFFRRQLREHPARYKAVEYLRGRGLSAGVVRDFGIGYAPPGWDGLVKALVGNGASFQDLMTAGLARESDSGSCYDRFRGRITFPIRDQRGRTIAFGGRTLDDATPKYLNSPETPFFHKGRELYGLYEARMSQRRLQRLMVVEGYMDVVALAQHDIRYVVATLGTATTPEHLERLFRVCSEVLFCFDGDQAGRKAAWRALETALPLLRDGRQANFLFLPEGEDPDSLVRKEGKDAFEQRLDSVVTLSDYFFEQVIARVNGRSLDGRARLVEQARILLEKLPDSVFRDMMVQRLANVAKMASVHIAKRFEPQISTPSGRRNRDAALTRTPLRRAIALLLACPSLAQQAEDLSEFSNTNEPGLPLLVELIELLRSNPQINTAALLERYRDKPEGRILDRLAEWRSDLPEDRLEEEFRGSLRRLKERYSNGQRLLEKLILGEVSLEQLNSEQKQILRKLRESSVGQSSSISDYLERE